MSTGLEDKWSLSNWIVYYLILLFCLGFWCYLIWKIVEIIF